jgi:hypothetical protein
MDIKRIASKIVENKGPITTHLMVAAGSIVGLVVVDKILTASKQEPGATVLVEGDINIEAPNDDQ